MGITSFSIELIEKYKGNAKTVCELGAQNLYDKHYGSKAPYADVYYQEKGIEYSCIDLSEENNCIVIDLSKPHKPEKQYDLVTDFGTSEHVGVDGKHKIEAIYNCWKTKHELLKKGGVMINENPKTGNWFGHGFNYYTKEFYEKLAELCGYEILEVGEHPAMGNVTDGWNVYCVLRKTSSKKFISIAKFKTCGIKTS